MVLPHLFQLGTTISEELRTEYYWKLVDELKKNNLLWSYDLKSSFKIPDDEIIEKILIYGDIYYLAALASVYPYEKVRAIFERVFQDPGKSQSRNFLEAFLFNNLPEGDFSLEN